MEARGGGSIVTLTYLGSTRVFPNYNVMGVAKAALEASVRYLAADLGPQNIRVNAISAGPVKTLAAAGIGGFSKILGIVRERAPLRRTIEAGEVADAAVFLLGPGRARRHRRSGDGRRRLPHSGNVRNAVSSYQLSIDWQRDLRHPDEQSLTRSSLSETPASFRCAIESVTSAGGPQTRHRVARSSAPMNQRRIEPAAAARPRLLVARDRQMQLSGPRARAPLSSSRNANSCGLRAL